VSLQTAPASLNPDRLRWIDYWIGIPICFLLTLVSKVTDGVAGARRQPDAPKNVLFVELAEMGSTVIACPAVDRLKSQYPGCNVFFLLFKHIDESVKVLNLVPDSNVLTIDISSPVTLVRDTLRFMRDARRLQIDTVINLEMFARFSTILTYLSGARRRVGFHPFTQHGLYIGDLFTHRVIYNPHIHTWQSLLALVEALSVNPGELPLGKFPAAEDGAGLVPHIVTDEAARRRIRELVGRESAAVAGKRIIAVNPNASKLISIRKWPLDRYAELVARLVDDPQNACVITGVASEKEDARFILNRVKSDRVVDLTGKTSLRELIDLFNVADLLITNDSGPAHFAALTDVPVLVFFGPETPRLYKPLSANCTVMYSNYACSPCVSAYNQRRSPCTNNRCLTEIGVEEVYRVAVGILEGAKGTKAESANL
jgi:ADP-heptose:LPS heptosyltransferase